MNSELAPLSNIEAIVFDVIGTLVDEDATFASTSAEVAARSGIADADQLCTEWVRLLDARMNDVVTATSPWQPHRHLVSAAGQEAVQNLGGKLTPEVTQVLNGVDRMYRAWPDVAAGMRQLASDHLMVGLSNGDLSSLAWLASSNQLSWHVALSTAAVRTFKPADAAYQYVAEAVDLDPTSTLFVAAHAWDLRAAAKQGFRTAFVSRPRADRPAATDVVDVTVDDLLELAQRV
ncbi:haloacid dehalogenase type II [Subtercola sp. YIM 133946]|uniref:haloacid dehalogenase type II n=1 Tax=Subtercola sp. YIM 133946 TaxID=3118909 RepID=UPI002F94D9B6